MDFVGLLNALTSPVIVVTALVDAVSMPLYLLEIVVILRTDSLRRHSFFTLFIVRALVQFLYVGDSYVMYRVPVLNLLFDAYSRLPNWALALQLFLVPYSVHADNLATAAILVNRFTAIAFPVKYKRIWRHPLTLVSVALVLLLPIPFCAPFLDTQMALVATNTSYFIAPSSNGDSEYAAISLQNTLSAVLFCALCSLLNVGTLVAYKSSPKPQSVEERTRDRAEVKLTVYALVMFLGQTLLAAFYIGTNLLSNAQDTMALDASFVFFPLLLDFFSIALPSWLLLWSSTPMRSALRAFLGLRSAEHSSTPVRTMDKSEWNRQGGAPVGGNH